MILLWVERGLAYRVVGGAVLGSRTLSNTCMDDNRIDGCRGAVVSEKYGDTMRRLKATTATAAGVGIAVLAMTGLLLVGSGCGDDDGGCPDSMLTCGDECVDTQVDPDHCGDCDTVCGDNAVCEAGVCACQGDYVDCSGDCVDTDLDPEHCGGCDEACDAPTNASGVCVTGSCDFVCDTGHLDCDTDAANGCEIDSTNDASHCGACATVCQDVNATNSCTAGVCSPICNALWDDCDGDGSNGCELDVGEDVDNCGSCGNVCGTTQPYCIEGTCVAEPPSCAAALAADSSATDGEYAIRPPGSGAPFNVYCDMTTQGGGWSLMAIFVNDGTPLAWAPQSTSWIDNQAFGSAWEPTFAGDAKSPGWGMVLADELMIVAAPGTVEVVTDTGCLQGNSVRWLFERDSEDDLDCAYQCATVQQAGPWASAGSGHPFLLFRCDDGYDDVDVGGYTQSTDDNSFVTTLENYSGMNSFGFGAGSLDDYCDFNAVAGGTPDCTDATPRLLYVR